MFVSCKCCVLLGRTPCDELITRPEESYRLWCVVVCDLETSLGSSTIGKKYLYNIILYVLIMDRLCGLVVRVSGYRYRGL